MGTRAACVSPGNLSTVPGEEALGSTSRGLPGRSKLPRWPGGLQVSRNGGWFSFHAHGPALKR